MPILSKCELKASQILNWYEMKALKIRDSKLLYICIQTVPNKVLLHNQEHVVNQRSMFSGSPCRGIICVA